MGWFDEQIRKRKQADDEAFAYSFSGIAEAIMGRMVFDATHDSSQVTVDAIGEILTYYRVKPQEAPEDMHDMNEVLEYLMRPYGIMRRTVRLDKGWYRDAAGAMLGTRTDDGSVVALLPWGLFSYRFYDRKTGKYVHLGKKTEGMIASEALAFYKPFPLKKMSLYDFARYIVEQIAPADLVLLFLAMQVATMVGLLMPRLNALLFSDVLESGSVQMLLGMGMLMICTSISSLIFGTIDSLVSARISTRLSINVEAASMMRMLSMPATFFRDYGAGELSNRLSYLNTLANQLVDLLLSTGLTSVFSLAYLFEVIHYAPALLTPALVVTSLTIAVTVASMLLQTSVSKRQMLLSAKESGVSYGLISGIQKIRLSGAEKRAFSRWAKAYAQQAELAYNPPLLLKLSSVLTTAISLIGTMALYNAAIASHVSVSEYYAFNAAYGMVNGAFMSLAGVALSIAQIQPTIEMVRPLLETVPEISEDKEVVTHLTGGLELNHISFRYSDDMPLVLDDISLKVHPGEYVAIVGKTGCGKSTLMRILLGFETPQKGAVFYDGRDLSHIDLKSLRRRIGTVMQNGKLFNGDIFSNITIVAPWLTLDDAWEAAEIAGLADDIRHMPMGMHTLISEGQGGVSGGQRQRILIARAVAPKPKILMFDEATSALDNLTQRQVSEALDRMNCTRLVIAHRLSTIRQCDRIIVLDKGTIVEDGTYDQLIDQGGFFADLVARQRLDTPAERA